MDMDMDMSMNASGEHGSKSCIILTGMPASGKSTVGVILAKVLGLDFIDTDLLIQKREGCRLENIIKSRGIEGFLGIEEEVCKNLSVSDSVIATGGSVVYSGPAMRNLKDLGTVVYLHVDRDTLKSRLSDMIGRGVVLREGQSFEELYDERIALYEKYADLTVFEEGLTLEKTVRKAAELFQAEHKREPLTDP